MQPLAPEMYETVDRTNPEMIKEMLKEREQHNYILRHT